jgi:hypothetical protein
MGLAMNADERPLIIQVLFDIAGVIVSAIFLVLSWFYDLDKKYPGGEP